MSTGNYFVLENTFRGKPHDKLDCPKLTNLTPKIVAANEFSERAIICFHW